MRSDFIAVLTRPLSASEVQKAKPADKDYELFDEQGLLLFVRTTGKKIWRFRYKRPGSPPPSDITPRCRLRAPGRCTPNISPCRYKASIRKKGEQENAEREPLAVDSLFTNVAIKWFTVKKTKISADDADDIYKSLARDVFSAIGQPP